MKITIVQREIEEAIRDFIRKQISVNEGMEITMDFTSTRGEDGLVAAIDISPAAEASTKQVTVRESSAEAPTQMTRTPRARQTAESKPAANEAQEAADAEPAETEEAPAAAGPAAEPEESLVPGDQPLAKSPSIFAGLHRPRSEEAAA